MRILHLTPSVGPRSYGLGQVAVNLARAQQKLNQDSVIWCLDGEGERRAAAETWGLPPESIRAFRIVGPERTGWSPELLRTAKEQGRQFDVVHQHGIWTGVSYVTKMFATRLGRPTVVAPHGSLASSALAKSWRKKRLASFLYESANLKNASCLHATSHPEIADFREHGLTRPLALITNGVSDEWLQGKGNGALFREAHSIPADRRIVLFLSRITPKKGLPMLLKAWADLEGRRPHWLLVVIGGDEGGHKRECESLARQLGVESSVRFLDAILGPGRRDAFAAADVFVLPTWTEGAPLVVLECLGAGVPAIVTRGAAWADLATYGCGWWVDVSAEGIRVALEAAIGLPPEKLREMGRAGRTLVAARYNWRTLAEQTIQLYLWLMKEAAQPDFVSTP